MRTRTILTGTAALAASTLFSTTLVAPQSAGSTSSAGPVTDAATAATAVCTWNRIAARTIFQEGGTHPGAGALYLGFASLAVNDAVETSLRQGRTSITAAVAQAAHDVLAEYFTSAVSEANLAADLEAALAVVPDGPREAKGVRIGRAAAAEMIASRVGDGRNDPSIVYSKPPAIGIWQPAPGAAMQVPWLGFVKPLVIGKRLPVDGPDALTSTEYAADYNEVKMVGSVNSTARTPEQTSIATFFASNALPTYSDALCTYLAGHPMSARQTALLFARINASAADSIIQTFRLKYDVGFWRPFQAIALAAEDGNPATELEAGWAPLIPNPSYSDYTSGHAGLSGPFFATVRVTLGDNVPLVLVWRNPDGTVKETRSYDTIGAIQYDALNARIWGGLHFRDAMEDGYDLGYRTAARVRRLVD